MKTTLLLTLITLAAVFTNVREWDFSKIEVHITPAPTEKYQIIDDDLLLVVPARSGFNTYQILKTEELISIQQDITRVSALIDTIRAERVRYVPPSMDELMKR